MGETLLSTLPWAIGVLISPTATTAVILLLMTPRASANATAMIAGWLVSLCLVTVIAYVGVTSLGIGDTNGRGTGDEITSLILGGLLLIMGGLALRRALHRTGTPAEMPRWLRAVDSFTPRRSFVVGLALADVKNLVLAVAAVTAVTAGAAQTQPLPALAVFVLVGSLGVLIPAGVCVLRGDRAEPTLKRWRDWLVAHDALIVSIVLVACGAAQIARGLGA